ncbi:hypothetical protein EJB05_07923, partial [Eragrostis curvula]
MTMTTAPAPGAGTLRPPAISGAAATAAAATKPAAPALPRFRYTGVQQSPSSGVWTAHVDDPDLLGPRVIGAFADEHAAALAHDRVAIAFHGDGARINFGPAFHPVERQFLRRCRMRRADIDVCAIVADGSYEARYATFLRAVFALERYGEFLDVMIQFFIDRAAEIGMEALEAGGDKLVAKFVAMHRNKAVDPAWRGWYNRKVAQCLVEMERQKQIKQQQFTEQKATNKSSSSTVLSRPLFDGFVSCVKEPPPATCWILTISATVKSTF